MLVTDGDDIRKLPLTMRKTNLARLLAQRVEGILIADVERGEIGQSFSGTPARWDWKAWRQTGRSAISHRPITALGKGQKPGISCNATGQRCVS